VYAQRWERRVTFAGPLVGPALEAAYDGADVVVLPSRGESFGMVVTEALARGLPVVATRTGGVPEALGRAPGGTLPGLLVAPDDPAALADALTRWLDEQHLRNRLRRAAASRRPTLSGWGTTAAGLADVLTSVGGRVGTGAGSRR
jgi:glycosyltransferase involved in cell wall biosynthesis